MQTCRAAILTRACNNVQMRPRPPHVWAQCQSRSAWRHLDEVRAPWAHPDTQLQASVSRRPPAATGMRWKHRHVLRLPPQGRLARRRVEGQRRRGCKKFRLGWSSNNTHRIQLTHVWTSRPEYLLSFDLHSCRPIGFRQC